MALWYGASISVDVQTGLAYTFMTTAVNEHDLGKADQLLQDKKEYIFAGSGYRGTQKPEELNETTAVWYIAEQPIKSKTQEAS